MMQRIHCPNCGALAERHSHPLLGEVRTQCDACDYLLVTCAKSGRVLESYAPGLEVYKTSQRLQILLTQGATVLQ